MHLTALHPILVRSYKEHIKELADEVLRVRPVAQCNPKEGCAFELPPLETFDEISNTIQRVLGGSSWLQTKEAQMLALALSADARWPKPKHYNAAPLRVLAYIGLCSSLQHYLGWNCSRDTMLDMQDLCSPRLLHARGPVDNKSAYSVEEFLARWRAQEKHPKSDLQDF